MIRVCSLGWKAADALARSGGSARVFAALSESIYLTAGDELLWLGRAGSPLHPRAILTRAPLPAARSTLTIAVGEARPWTPPAPARGRDAARRLAAGVRELPGALAELGAPEGFGALLAGGAPPFPLERATPRALSLADACARDDPEAAVAAATALVGLGPGLTPSGDDYVGGAFFGRALLAAAGACDRDAWARAAGAVLARARAQTHPISVALLGDMLEGHGHAPLHELAGALAAGGDRRAAVDAARRLVAIGHSSGWDMLAGFVAAFPARM